MRVEPRVYNARPFPGRAFCIVRFRESELILGRKTW